MKTKLADGDLLMDVPPIPWTALKSLAADRQLWRKHVRAKFVTLWPDQDNTPTPTPTKQPETATEHTKSPMAKRYIQRDRHAAFFMPYSSLSKAHLKQKRDRQRKLYKSKKNKMQLPKSKKERYEEMCLEHELQHMSPDILGPGYTHSTYDPSIQNTLLPPIHFNDMFEYLDNLSQHHADLKQLP